VKRVRPTGRCPSAESPRHQFANARLAAVTAVPGHPTAEDADRRVLEAPRGGAASRERTAPERLLQREPGRCARRSASGRRGRAIGVACSGDGRASAPGLLPRRDRPTPGEPRSST
jgi:hypothetical protein